MKYLVILFLTSCTSIHSSQCIYTPIPDKWRAPLQKKLDTGFYDCGSKIANCVTKKDALLMIENKANMEEAQRQLVKLIDSMNEAASPEVRCGFFDRSCKKSLQEKQHLPMPPTRESGYP